MTLPPLPEPYSLENEDMKDFEYYNKEHLIEYALAVLEAAAKVCEEISEQERGDSIVFVDHSHSAKDYDITADFCAAAIRAMKESTSPEE